MNHSYAKTWLGFGLGVASIISLVGCGGSSSGQNNKAPEAATKQERDEIQRFANDFNQISKDLFSASVKKRNCESSSEELMELENRKNPDFDFSDKNEGHAKMTFDWDGLLSDSKVHGVVYYKYKTINNIKHCAFYMGDSTPDSTLLHLGGVMKASKLINELKNDGFKSKFQGISDDNIKVLFYGKEERVDNTITRTFNDCSIIIDKKAANKHQQDKVYTITIKDPIVMKLEKSNAFWHFNMNGVMECKIDKANTTSNLQIHFHNNDVKVKDLSSAK